MSRHPNAEERARLVEKYGEFELREAIALVGEHILGSEATYYMGLYLALEKVLEAAEMFADE